MDNEQAPEQEPESNTVDLSGLQDLAFGPSWARRSPGEPPPRRFTEQAEDGRGRGGPGRRPERDARGPRPGGPRPGGMRDGRDDRRGDDRRGRGGEAPAGRGPRDARYGDRIPLPVFVRFLPDQKHLSRVVRQVAASKQAHPVDELAKLFMTSLDHCSIRLETPRERPEVRLFQCKTCKTVALDRTVLASHILKEHLKDYFEVEETEIEAPTGQFSCVMRCGLTGILLGPPNHHSYTEKVQEVRNSRYPGMSLEEYRGHIETLRDPESIEKWKQESRKQTLYRLKKGQEPGEAEPLRWSAAEAYVLKNIAPALTVEAQRAVLPASIGPRIEDRKLLLALRDALQREARMPRSIPSALHAAFRNMKMHLFRNGSGREYVTATPPAPLGDTNVIGPIREVLTALREKPACTRAELLQALRPGMNPASPEAVQVLSPLGWLVDKGHIIEFSDGRLLEPSAEEAKGTPIPPEAIPPADAVPADAVPAGDAIPPAEATPPAEA